VAQQPPLGADDAKQRGHGARRELSHIASSRAVGCPTAAARFLAQSIWV
jgi:hypothetical protein